MTHVAVTGANGMTGSHMVSLLKSEGFLVNSVTRNVWDLTEWKSFDEMDYIFKNVSAVFHFGAQLPNNNLTHDNLKTKQIFDANTRSCLNLAEWAQFKGIPIIFLSSSTIYKNPNASQITEADLKVGTQFGGFYAYSKILAEDIFSYLLVNDNIIWGVFSYKYNTNKIEIILFKIINILEYYVENFIYVMFNNIILDFDYVYINKNNIEPKKIF